MVWILSRNGNLFLIQHLFLKNINDLLTSEETNISFAFKILPDKAIFTRLIVNNRDISAVDRVTFF
jgi:hypothetical protein